MDTSKFGGVGLINMIVIALFVMLFIVMTKVALTKKPIPGVTEFVHTI